MKTEFKTSFLKAIKKVKDIQLKDDIIRAIINVESAEDIKQISQLKKLKGYHHYYRIKIGNYRIGIKIDSGIVFFVDVDHRNNIYRIFPK
jgi:mRNA interferase RelE/StbE